MTTDVLLEALSWPHEHWSENCTCSQHRENILLENNQIDTHTGHWTVQSFIHATEFEGIQNVLSLGHYWVAISDVNRNC